MPKPPSWSKEQTAIRQAEFRKRREAQGLVLLQGIWVPAELLPAIKEMIAKLIADHNDDGGGVG